jgi:GNAT superfamily N-acetyltransferase
MVVGALTTEGDVAVGAKGLGVTFRAATREDSRRIAELFRVSSDGVVDYVWSTLAPQYPGLAPIEIGALRYAREEGNFSYRNCVVAERDGAVIGQLCTYPIEASAEEPDEPSDPVLEPYERLEIPGTLYISSLVVVAEFRGRGLGAEMLVIARDQAREVFQRLEPARLRTEHRGSPTLRTPRLSGGGPGSGRAAPPHPPHGRRPPDGCRGLTPAKRHAEMLLSDRRERADKRSPKGRAC